MAVELLTERETAGPPPSADEHRSGRRMLTFFGRRLIHLVGLLIGVALLGFLLMEMSPVDPIDAYVGGDAVRLGEDQRALIAERWGLNDPAPERLARWATNLASGDMGTSTVFNAPVTQVIGQRFVVSLALLATAWVLSGAIGFILGLVAAALRGTLVDRGIRWVAYTLASAPTFWVGLLFLTLFAVQLGWAPTSGATPLGIDPAMATLGERLHHLALPALTLSIVGIAPVTLHTRARAVEVLGSDAVLFARAQGDSGWSLVRNRVIRNAAVPALMLQFASFSELLGGSVLAEQVFNYPGLGQATVRAGIQGDIPLLLGISLFATILVFVGNQLGDLAQRMADPRVPMLERGMTS